ncbi:VOC family protein [Lentzea xinjiangensis]|uniref:VOC family protein n=1 Tax=Lentzea xinjiangensis TaxID=402600 RepID=UPI0024820FB6|nr:VOC family protein [Lentzea xinjiangensis]
MDGRRRGTAPLLPPSSARLGVTVRACVLPYRDLDASVTFYRDVLGWEVRVRAGSGTERWVEVGPSAPLATSVVLVPFAEAGGDSGVIYLSTEDGVDIVFAAVLTTDAEVVQEPTDQPWGVRDFVLRDPAGNTIRIQQR